MGCCFGYQAWAVVMVKVTSSDKLQTAREGIPTLNHRSKHYVTNRANDLALHTVAHVMRVFNIEQTLSKARFQL